MKRIILTFVLSLIYVSANAALISRAGGSAYYDDVLNITWLADANLAATNTFGLAYNTDFGMHPNDNDPGSYSNFINTDGKMNWGAALHWIDAMNTANYLDTNNWRLPTALNQDGSGPCGSAYNCVNSEMGSLYYTTLGNVGGESPSNTGPFSSEPSWWVYWSNTEDVSSPQYAWLFAFYHGFQDYSTKSNDSYYAWAVADGDIAVTAVPIPAAVWLFGSGLGLLGWVRRKTN